MRPWWSILVSCGFVEAVEPASISILWTSGWVQTYFWSTSDSEFQCNQASSLSTRDCRGWMDFPLWSQVARWWRHVFAWVFGDLHYSHNPLVRFMCSTQNYIHTSDCSQTPMMSNHVQTLANHILLGRVRLIQKASFLQTHSPMCQQPASLFKSCGFHTKPMERPPLQYLAEGCFQHPEATKKLCRSICLTKRLWEVRPMCCQDSTIGPPWISSSSLTLLEHLKLYTGICGCICALSESCTSLICSSMFFMLLELLSGLAYMQQIRCWQSWGGTHSK